MFRPEAVLALLTAAAPILPARGRSRRLTFAPGLVISAGALALMLVSRYAHRGSSGPFPDSYDPVWFPESCGPPRSS